jgi:hypothetical protein
VPSGPFFGPVTLNINMSGSADPEGVPIDEYEIRDGGVVRYKDVDSSVDLEFQPGCHTLDIIVYAGSSLGRKRCYFKVYPKWSDGAIQVAQSTVQNFAPRLQGLRSERDPADGSFYCAGYDFTIPGLAFWRIKPGVGQQLAVGYVEAGPGLVAEPVLANGEFYYAAVFDDLAQIYASDGERVRIISSVGYISSAVIQDVAIAADSGGRIWMAVLVSEGGEDRIELVDTSLDQTHVMVQPTINNIQCVDLAYNPA